MQDERAERSRPKEAGRFDGEEEGGVEEGVDCE
jgi:hypothetical protein